MFASEPPQPPPEDGFSHKPIPVLHLPTRKREELVRFWDAVYGNGVEARTREELIRDIERGIIVGLYEPEEVFSPNPGSVEETRASVTPVEWARAQGWEDLAATITRHVARDREKSPRELLDSLGKEATERAQSPYGRLRNVGPFDASDWFSDESYFESRTTPMGSRKKSALDAIFHWIDKK